jgi:hypothetical protein
MSFVAVSLQSKFVVWQVARYRATQDFSVERVHFRFNWLGVAVPHPERLHIRQNEEVTIHWPFWKSVPNELSRDDISKAHALRRRWAPMTQQEV